MTRYALSPFSGLEKYFIGYDNIFDHMLSLTQEKDKTSFPPHSIYSIDSNTTVIEMAIAGFSKDDVSIELKDDVLIVKGTAKDQRANYQFKGIATRSFIKSFTIAKDIVKVSGATVKDGILSIYLEKIKPKNPDAVQIPITDEVPKLGQSEPEQLNG